MYFGGDGIFVPDKGEMLQYCTYPIALGMLGIGLLTVGTEGVSQLMPQMFAIQ